MKEYNEVIKGGQGRTPEQLVRDCLILGIMAIIGLGSFLVALILQIVK